MKKPIIWGFVIIALLLGGDMVYLHNSRPQSSNVETTKVHVNKNKKRSAKPPLPEKNTSNQDSSKETSNKDKNESSSTSSSSTSNTQSSDNTNSSSSSVNTGNAGKQGAGKMGDHTVNGKTVQDDTLAAIKKQLNALGFDANSWSPQDMIDLYRYANRNGTTSPEAITKDEVNAYLKQ